MASSPNPSRARIPRATKPGRLEARWGLADKGAEPSICYIWGGGGTLASDARIVSNAFEGPLCYQLNHASMAALLRECGYDMTTFRFSVDRHEDQERTGLPRGRASIVRPVKAGRLAARWGRADRDDGSPSVVSINGAGGATKAHAVNLLAVFYQNDVYGGRNLVDELVSRGYDLSTLRFKVDLLHPTGAV